MYVVFCSGRRVADNEGVSCGDGRDEEGMEMGRRSEEYRRKQTCGSQAHTLPRHELIACFPATAESSFLISLLCAL